MYPPLLGNTMSQPQYKVVGSSSCLKILTISFFASRKFSGGLAANVDEVVKTAVERIHRFLNCMSVISFSLLVKSKTHFNDLDFFILSFWGEIF